MTTSGLAGDGETSEAPHETVIFIHGQSNTII
jgi:hypothetical protein